MGTIADAISTIWRDYATSGVAASGLHEPEKSEIRELGPVIEAVIAAIQAAGLASVSFDTKANMDADLAHDADVVAIVYADATEANNDLYIKSGASGAGSWDLTGTNGIIHDTIDALAQPYVDTANAFANEAEDTEVEPGLYSAKHWALKAAAELAGLPTSSSDWVRTDERGDKALLDIDHRNQRYWFNGTVYASAAALYAAMTGVTQHGSERIVTFGPVRDGSELLAGGAFADAGDVAEWTAGGGATVTALTPGIAISGVGGYAYQEVTGLTIGAAYQLRVTDLTVGASYGRVSVGTTAGGSEIMAATNVTNDATSTYTIYPTAETIYINLLAWSTGAERRYAFAGLEHSTPFVGFDYGTGTLITEFTEQAVAAASTLAHLRNGPGTSLTTNTLSLNCAATGEASASIRDADTNFQYNSATLGRMFAGRDNVGAIAWAVNDVHGSANGQVGSTAEDSAATIPNFDRLCVGNISGTGIMGGTLQRLTYFPRRVAAITEREEWWVKFPDAILGLGDSFMTDAFRDTMAAQYPGRPVFRDGVGGSTLRQQLDRYLRIPALHCCTLVIMDGSGDNETRTLTSLPALIEAAGHRRVIKIEASPAEAIAGSPERATFDAILAIAIDIMGPGHHVSCLAALQAANDDSPEDLQDVADNIVPRSLRQPGDSIHEVQAATDIRVDQLKAHTDAYPWLLLPVPA